MPELKYCTRCGVFLGAVRSTKLYCAECKSAVDQERKKKYKASNHVSYGATTCELCGKPMIKRSGTQKYHAECQKEAYAIKRAEYRETRKSKRQATPGGYNKRKKEKTLTVSDVSLMADKAGLSYGEMSLRMMQGKI